MLIAALLAVNTENGFAKDLRLFAARVVKSRANLQHSPALISKRGISHGRKRTRLEV